MRNRFAASLLSLALCVSGLPVLAQETGTSALEGQLRGVDGEPLGGAVLVAYHLSSESVFRSEPTGRDGKYRLVELPYGYFDLAVETADGLYVADQVVNVPPSGTASLSLRIDVAGAGTTRAFPGDDEPPVGVASVSRRLSGRAFWRSPKGVAIIAGGAGAALLAIAAGGDDDPVASPIVP